MHWDACTEAPNFGRAELPPTSVAHGIRRSQPLAVAFVRCEDPGDCEPDRARMPTL
jgi:hypothetical protein